MRKKVVNLLLIMILVISFSITLNVYGADNLVLNVDKENVKPNDEIEITIDLNSQNTSLYAYTAKLSYDEEVFDEINKENFEEQENWSDITYNEQNNKFALINKEGKSQNKLLKLKLKVKDNAKAGKTAITLDQVSASDANKDINIEGSSAYVTVLKDGLAKNESIPNNNTEENVEEQNEIIVKKEFSYITAILIILVIIAILTVVYYCTKKDTSSRNKKIVLVIGVIVVAVLAFFAIKSLDKKDVDLDKNALIDYDDTKGILDYILEINNPSDDKKEEKDVNNDGKITITDVAYVVKEASSQDYNVDINEEENNGEASKEEYNTSFTKSIVSKTVISKGEEITLNLNIDVAPYTSVKSVVINGKEYSVEKVSDNSYIVKIPVSDKAGPYNITITKVVLDNSKEVSTNYSITVDILKDTPKAENLLIDTEKEIPEISFDVIDKDSALKGGRFVVTNEYGIIMYESFEVANGKNTFLVNNLKKDTKYFVNVELEYDLDSNLFGAPEDYSKKEIVISNEFVLNVDYGFEGANYEITKKVSKDEPLILTFANSYDSFYDVDYIVVDGKKYKVNKVGNKYQVEIDKKEKGNNEIVISEVILKNGESYTVNEKLSYTYLKDIPEVYDIEAKFTSESDIKVTYETKDEDNTVKKVKVYLLDQDGNVVEEKEVDKTAKEAVFKANKNGSYKVKVEVTYELGDGEEVTKEVEYENDIKVPVEARIVSTSLDNAYVEKNEQVEVVYDIESNTEDLVTSLVINGVTVPVTKNAEGKYTASFSVSSKAEEVTLDITSIVFANEGSVSTNYTSKFYVLKDVKPSVDGLSVVDRDGNNATVAFNIIDSEDTFVSGKVVVTNKTTNEKIFEKLFTNINDTVHNITNVEDFENYNVDIYITYDFDNDKKDTKNQKEEILASKEFELIGNYEFNFSNLQINNVDRTRNIVTLEFNASLAEAAADTYFVETVMIDGTSYNVTKVEDGKYTVEVPFEDTNRKVLTVQEVILNNSQGFKIDKNNEIVIFKTAPSAIVRNLLTRANENEFKNLNASLEIIDVDNTIVEGTIYAKLVDTKGNSTESIKLDKTSESISFVKDSIYPSGTYKIEVYADYITYDGTSKYTEEKLGETKITVPTYAKIDSASINKYYAEKNEILQITYSVTSNNEEMPNNIVVNNENLTPRKVDTGKYVVDVKAPEKCGKYSFDTTRFVYNEEQTSVTNLTDIDVLKTSIPSVSDIYVDDLDIENPMLSFKVLDEENAFVSGKVAIKNSENTLVKEIPFDISKDILINLNELEKNYKYNLEIEIIYDLDSDKEDETNRYTLKTDAYTFDVIKDYDFNIANFKLENINENTQEIEVSFESSNATKYPVKSVVINDKEYEVVLLAENKYTVKIPYETTDRTELKLQKAKLSNLKEFSDINLDNIVVFKNAPIVNIKNTVVSSDMKSISANFDIIDTDNVISSTCAKLINENGDVLQTKTLGKYEREIEFVATEDSYLSGNYKVEIYADYDRADAKEHKMEKLASSEAKIDIFAKIASANTDKYYYEKNSVVNITYDVITNTDKELISFVINDNIVSATKNEEGKYVATLNAKENAGECTYTLSKVIFAPNYDVDVESKNTVYVLKNTMPLLSGLEVDTTKKEPTLSFMIEDTENTFVKGRLVITNTEKNESYEIPFNDLSNLSFKLSDIEELVKYEASVYITYDFDENNENKENEKEVLMAKKSFRMIQNYNFTLSNYKVKEVDNARNVVVLQFESTNASENNEDLESYYVDTVVINGNTYEDVRKEGTVYTVEVPFTEKTRQEFVIQKAILSNLQGFDITSEITETNTVVVFKSLTGIVIATVDGNLKSIKADVTLIDKDNIATNVYVRLLDSKNQVIDNKELEGSNEYSISFDKDGYYTAGDYTVELVASFDAVDGLTHKDEVIASTTAKVSAGAMIEAVTCNKYAKKGEKIEVIYDILTNTNEELASIVVNNEAYNVQKLGDNKYKIEVNGFLNAGVNSLNVTRLNFANTYANVDYTSEIEILKSTKPTINNLVVDENSNNPIVSFDMSDDEDTFVSGRIVVKDTKTNEEQEITFNQKKDLKFALNNLEKFKKYDISIYLTYDFDENKEENKNQDTYLAINNQFELIGDYNFTLENLKVVNVNRDEKVVTLEFESTNNSELNEEYTNYHICEVTINGNIYDNVVRKENHKYTVDVKYVNEERTELVLQSAKLDNLKEFTNIEKSVVIFKNAPSVEVNAHTNDTLDKIIADIKIVDGDSSLLNLNAKLIAPNGQTLYTRDIDNEETTTEFKPLTDGEIFNAGEYTVQIGADFDITDGLLHNSKELIGEGKVKIPTKASIIEAQVENYYVRKGEMVNIKYKISSNNENNLSGVSLADSYYKATLNEDNTYSVSIPAKNEGYGENSHIVSIVMYDNETVKLDETKEANYYLLKNEPQVTDFTFNKYEKNQKLTFNFKNDEKALLDLPVLVVKDKDNRSVITHNIEEGENTVWLKNIPNGTYKVGLTGKYDLDDSFANGANTYNLSNIFEETSIDVITNYNLEFNIKDVAVDKANGEVVLTFTSSNYANYDVDKLYINDGYVDVVKEGEVYKAKIKYEDETSKKYKITKVKLENEIELELGKEETFEIFKQAPTADITCEVSEDAKNITATLKLNDMAQTVSKLYARLLDKSNALIEEKIIDVSESKVIFTSKDGSMYNAGSYVVEVGADYNRVDGENHNTKETIERTDVTVDIIAKIVSSNAAKYTAKNKDVKLEYNILSNTQDEPSSIVINEKPYNIAKVGDKYEVTYTSKDSFGNEELVATKLKYEKDVNVDNRLNIYVLKDVPSITSYNFDDKSKIPNITFEYLDGDNATVDGAKVILYDLDTGRSVIETPLNKGENKIELAELLKLPNDTYMLKIEGKYDLDGNFATNENEYDIASIFEQKEIQFISDYNLKFDLQNVSVLKESRKVKVYFESSNVKNYPVKEVTVDKTKYEVYEENGESYILVDYENEEDKVFTISDIVLSNGTNLELENEVTFEIFKEKPVVKDLKATVTDDDINASYSITDNDNILENIKVVLETSDGQNVMQKEIDRSSTNVTFENILSAGSYTVKIIADYNRVDGEDHKGETLANTDVSLQIIASIEKDIKECYANKNQNINITYFVKDNTFEQVTKMTINDNVYEVTKNENDSYNVSYAAKNSAGEEKLVVKELEYANGEKVKVNYESAIEVLKDKLSINNFSIDYSSGSAILTIDMLDNDNSFSSGIIKVTNTKNNETKNITISKAENEYNLNLEELAVYIVELEITYDLDKDIDNSLHLATETFKKLENVQLVNNYMVQITDFNVTEIDREIKYSAIMQFNFANASIYDIKTVTIGDLEYEVQKVEDLDGVYTFSYVFEEEGLDVRKELAIKEVTLTNNVKVKLEEEPKVVLFKNKPIASNLLLENVDNNKVKATFEITDTDNTLYGLNAILKEEDGDIVTQKNIELNEREVIFDVLKAGKYTVEINANYSSVDGLTHENVCIATTESTVEIAANANVVTKSISTNYPEKNEKVEIKYEITSNTNLTPKKIVLNDKAEYTLTQSEEENVYSVTYNAPSEAEVVNLQVTKVFFDTDEIASVTNAKVDVLEVLKAKPTITVNTTDILEREAVLFDINITDVDGAMTSGKAKFHNEELELNRGPNSWSVSVSPDEAHTIDIEVNYDLDQNIITAGTERNDNTGTITQSKQFTLVSDYGLEISDVKLFNLSGKEIEYANKGEKVELRFNSSNKTSLLPDKITVNDVKNEGIGGIEYSVKSIEDETSTYNYAVELVANSNAGVQEFEISSVKLSSGKVIDKSKFAHNVPNTKLEVLKDKPQMTDYNVNNQANTLTVNFNIVDNDGALKTSNISLIDTKTNSVVQSKEIVKGTNTHIFNDLIPGNKYVIKIENNYSLSEDGKISGNEKFSEEEIQITKEEESNFKVRNLAISKRVKSGAKVNVSFQNSLMSYKDVDTIVIDGTDYSVNKDEDNTYRLNIDPKDTGVNTIHIQSAKIEGKAYDIDRNMSYIYEKEVPTAENVTEIFEDTSTGEAVIRYKLIDKDSAVKELTAYMKNSAGSVIATKKIDLTEDETKTVTMPLLKISTYSIELKATWDIGDGVTFEDVSLLEKTKYTMPRVSIMTQEINKEYVEKGEEVELKFKINTNVDQEVKKIYINEEGYNVKKVTDDKGKIIEDTYTLTVNAPEKSGVFEQKVTKIQIGPNPINVTYPENSDIIKIKVLKDIPSLTHFIVDEKNGTVSFKVNDTDKSLITPNPVFKVKENDVEIYNDLLKNGGTDYVYELQKVNINKILNPYNVSVDVTYDRRPDSPSTKNIFEKIYESVKDNILKISSEEEQEGPDEEIEEPNYEITENIFNENIELTGDIDYDLHFDAGVGFLFSLNEYMLVDFECSTGTKYGVTKVIIDGREYPVTKVKDKGDGLFRYEGYYRAFDYTQDSITFEKVILENGTAIEIEEPNTREVFCMVIQKDPTFNVTDFIENVKEGTVTFNYKLVDDDMKLYSDLTFTLMDSQGSVIDTKVQTRDKNSVEFNIPNPPTSIYRLRVTGKSIIMPGYTDYLLDWVAHDEEYKSSVNTSILRSKISNKYPKKGETITIDYGISSTKVILIDKEDHTNQDKAVSITALVINDKEYEVQPLEEKEQYRIYYTAGEEDKIEDLQVTKVIFSNGDIDDFIKEDKIEVLKDAPYITDFKTENNLETNKVKFTFKVVDNDNVLGLNSIYATFNEQVKDLNVGDNTVEFDANLDELANLEIKASYDLDSNTLPNETETNDNLYTENTIFERPILLTGDYGIEFSNIETFNTDSVKKSYFEKNEDIKVTFDILTKNPALYPETIVIDGNKYTIIKEADSENKYSTILPSNNLTGIKSSNISSVTLNSGNDVNVQGQTIEYEILKDAVKVESFTYDMLDNADRVKLSINIKDEDISNMNLRLDIQDENGNKIEPDKETLQVGENNVSFEKTTSNKYFVSVYSTYDRDQNNLDGINYYDDLKIYYKIVSLSTRYIEMKDIVDIKLYTYDDFGNVSKVDSLTEDNLSVVDNCLVEVTMKNIPTFYSKVTKYTVDGNKLKLVLEYTDAMVYTGESELKPLEVTLELQDKDSGYEYNGSFKSLVNKMRKEPNAEITLDKDYDLSDYVVNEKQRAIIDFDFKGKINGNGHTISNITKPLFSKLDGATLENLVIKGIVFSGNDAKAPIAITATNSSTISNVHVENLVSPGNGTGGLVYEVTKNSKIEKSSATNLTFNTNYLSQSVTAGLVSLRDNSTIENCYVQGTITSGWWNNAGLVVSTDSTCKIISNIVNIKMAASFALTDKDWGHGCGGIVCGDAQNGSSNGLTLKNNLSLVVGNNGVGAIFNYKKSKLSDLSENNYQLENAVVKNTHNSITTISEDKLNAEFFKNSLNLDTDIWTIDENASINNLPVLKGVSVSYSDGGKKPENTEIYIPDYNRVSSLKEYEPEREITYHNMYKIMPFYDAKEIIRDGNKIPEGHDLTKKIIRYIVPFNKEGKLVSNLTVNNYDSLDKIYIVFEDGTKLDYHIDFDDYYGNVASYMISDLNVGYNYSKYVIDPNQDIIKELVSIASKYEFNKDLAPVTTKVEEDSRLYVEHFDKYTKNHIEDFVLNILVNMGYTPNFASDVLDTKIRQELINTDKLKRLLFAYNYFTYWYNIDMDGINLADSVMFHSSEMFDKDMTMSYLTENLVLESNSATNGTAGFYNNYFVKYTKLPNLGYFLDYYVNTLTHYKNGNDWFTENWKGGRYYTVKLDDVEGVKYTLWDHLLKDGKVQTDFLPLFTVPENSMYAISSPTQAYFGSLRVYMSDPSNEEQIAAFETKVDKWRSEVKSFYKFAYDYWGKDILNKYCDVNYDMRTTYTGNGNATVYNNPLTTEEPCHKYFVEAVGRWAAKHGGAYANGNEVFWAAIKMLDNFRVGTHETLHNQDSKIFLNGYGRRGDAEDYAAGFIQQYYRDGWVSPNIFDEEPLYKENSTQNLRKSSVETDEKLHAFYNKYFRTNDYLDWIEAQAFLKLTAEQQANISVKVSYPEVQDQDAGDDVVAYSLLTKDEVEKMGLKDMASLWDNKIMLRPGVKDYERRSPGADTDSIFNIHWYQPHADNNRPDGANFKYLAWQMAGEKGYKEGLVPYYSLSYIGIKTGTNEKTTDLIALRYIMDDPNITFREYKLKRYEELSKYFNTTGTYIDSQTIYDEYLDALKKDADSKDRNLTRSTAVKKKYFQQIRLETDDFRIDPFTKKEEVNSAEELIKKINEDKNAIILLGSDIDLSKYSGKDTIISEEFSGVLDGNNNKIINVTSPIFSTLNNANIQNLKIENCNIDTTLDNTGILTKEAKDTRISNVVVSSSKVKGGNNVGAIAGIIDKTSLDNVHIKDCDIEGNNDTSGIVGYMKNESSISTSSVNANVKSSGTSAAVFVSKVEKSKITDCYAVGKLTANAESNEADIAGFVSISNNSNICNSIAKVEIASNVNSSGFISQAKNNVNVSNNLSLSSLENGGYKFDGKTEDIVLFSTNRDYKYSNNYELTETKGDTTSKRNDKISSIITEISIEGINENFFKNVLKYSTTLWDLSNVKNGELPKLKNNDPNESLKMFTEDIKLNTQSLIVENDINDLYNGNVNIYQEDVENKESKKEEETPDNIEIIMPPEEKTKEENITNNIDKRGLS